MPTYDFYVTVYYGSLIPQNAFDGLAGQAKRVLERFRTVYRIAAAGEGEEKLAICAMAETLYRFRKRGGVKSTRMGNVTVQYESQNKSLSRALFESAGIYLDIYRGAEA